MTKSKIMQTMPYDSLGTLVIWCQRYWQNSNEVTPTRAPNRGGYIKSSDFQTYYISETVQDNDMVTI